MSLIRKIFRSKAQGHPRQGSSRFERIEFAGRFECSLTALSHSGACEGLFLNRYAMDDIHSLFQRAGLIAHLSAKGFVDLRFAIESDESRMHSLKVYDSREAPDNLLIELRVSEIIYTPDSEKTWGLLAKERYQCLAVEWVNLQNPRGGFSDTRPRLPGQNHPGLGAAGGMLALLEIIARDVTAAAIIDVPESFHAAVMYSKRFLFIDPARQGMMEAALRDLAEYGLAAMSWGFATGAVRDSRTGAPIAYVPSEQVFPLDEDFKRYFASTRYRAAREAAMNETRLILDREAMESCKRSHPDISR